MRKLITILFVVVAVGIHLACDRNDQKRKIKLSDQAETQVFNQKLTTTIRLEPKERRTIAVMFFQNLTGDQNFEWLKKGLTEMLIRTLSQSSHLSILSTERLVEIIDRHAATKTSQDIDLDIAAFVGREANVEAVLVGQIKRTGGILRISVKLQEPRQGFILKEENVEGKGIDAIFSMVDELTEKVKNDLLLTFERAEAIRGISDITTNNLDAWREFSMGKDFVDKYLHNDAMPHFEKAVELDSNFAAAILDLYPLYRNTGENDRAMQLIKKLIELKPGCARKDQFEIDLFEANLNNDDLKYLETLEQWLQQFPEDRDAYMRMADVYRGWNNHEAEIQVLEKILSIDPKYKIAYNRLGYAYANEGNFDKAIEAIHRYMELAPDEVNPYDSAGEIYLLYGEYDKAEQYFNQALAINDSFLHSIIYLGNLNLFKGDYNQALKIYHKNLEKASSAAEKSDALFRLGNTNLILGDKENAGKNYEAALQKNPYNFYVLDLLQKTSTMPDDSNKINDLRQKTYNDLKTMLNSETERERALNSLAWLSIFWDVNRIESIEILNHLIKELEKSTNPSVVLYLTNLKFMLTLLYGKTKQYDRIDPLWVNQEIIPSEFWRFLRDAHNNSYSDQWRFFGLLNELFYQEIMHGFEFYAPLIKYANENQAQSLEMMFRLLLGNLYKFDKDTIKWEEEMTYIGVPSEKTWMAIGPFDYKDGFRRKYPPEKRIKLNKIYKENSWRVQWQHADDGMEDGFINFSQLFKKDNWKVAYGLIFIDSPDEREVQFRFGTDDGSKIWFNDQEIWKLNRTGDAIFDAYKRTVTLKKGSNKVMIKVFNTIGDWGFFFRVTDENGIGVKDLRFIAADEN